MHATFGEPDRYFYRADQVGVIGRGENIEAAFQDAAKAMFALIADASTVHENHIITFEFQEPDLERALVLWLSFLLDKARTHALIFSDFRLKREGDRWKAVAAGDKDYMNCLHKAPMTQAVQEVNSVTKTDHIWEVRCLLIN